MLEIGWSELLILAVVTLLFVGPKELPVFLRTIGRYAGTLRRHASEFRAQFDAAMREAELDAMKEEMKKMQASVNAEVMGAETALKDAGQATTLAAPTGASSTVGQPGSFTAAAASTVFPASAPMGQVYARPRPEEAVGAANATETASAGAPVATPEEDGAPASHNSERPEPTSVPMPAPANPET